MVDVSIQAYQNGELLDAAIAENNDDAVDRFMSEIQPGQTVNVCQVFSLNDDTNDVTLMANEAFNFGDTTTSSQIVKVR
jgi:signal transduction protein with GAF and PtsI domain